MGLHETEKLLHSKGNSHQTEDVAHRMGESLCQVYIWQVIKNKTIQGTQKTNVLPKINDPMKKWANELNSTCSMEEVQMAKKTHEKMPTIPGNKGKAN
jgi:hypothetical protein